MEELGTGTGLAALGFWSFIAAVVVAGIWDSIRKREAQHETLRRIIESGQPVDVELTDKILALTGGSKELDRDLKVSGLIVLFIAPGMLLFGWIMSLFVEPTLLPIMLAVAVLLLFIAIGLLVASAVVKRRYTEVVEAPGEEAQA